MRRDSQELQKQYETFLAKGQVLDSQGMPMVGGVKMDAQRHNPISKEEARSRAVQAAEARARTGGLMGGGRLGGGGGAGSSSGADWRGKTPGEMAAAAATSRLRAWDQANGLHDDELEAARQSQDDADDEDDAPRPRPAAGPSVSINWAGRGRGTWQAVACPVCGPACNASLHGPDDPPPQDEDEGGGVSGAPAGKGGSSGAPAGKGSSSNASGGKGGGSQSTGAKRTVVEIDLTGSDDEAAPVQEKPVPAKAGGTKRPLREMQAPNRGWTCKTCTFVNPSGAARCEMDCGVERPEGTAPPAAGASKTWACKQCTLSNSGEKTHCDACGTWRYHRPLP